MNSKEITDKDMDKIVEKITEVIPENATIKKEEQIKNKDIFAIEILLLSLISLYFILFYNDVLIKSINLLVNSVLLGKFGSGDTIFAIYRVIIIGILYLSVLIGIVPPYKAKWKGRIYFNFITFFLLITTLLFMWAHLANSNQTTTQNLENIGEEIAETQIGFWLNFKCNTLEILNENDQECIELKNENIAEVIETEKVNIKFIRNNIPQFQITNEEDSFLIGYDFETEIPITLTKLECFTNHNSKKAFDTKTDFKDLENNIVDKDTEILFECDKIVTDMKENKDSMKIISKLYFTLENTFSQDVLIINCNNENIQNFIKDKKIKCVNINTDMLNNEYSGNIPDYSKSAFGGNALKLDTSSFKNQIILHIGDEINRKKQLPLIISKNDDIGKLESGKITSVELPISLKQIDSNKQLLDRTLTSTEDKIATTLILEENEFELNKEIDLVVQTIKIKTLINAMKQGTTEDIQFETVGFEIKKEETKEQNNSINEETKNKNPIETTDLNQETKEPIDYTLCNYNQETYLTKYDYCENPNTNNPLYFRINNNKWEFSYTPRFDCFVELVVNAVSCEKQLEELDYEFLQNWISYRKEI